jgi:hypothetical protein
LLLCEHPISLGRSTCVPIRVPNPARVAGEKRERHALGLCFRQ